MDAESQALLRKVLKDNGCSLTAARLTVCNLLWGQEPQSMRELTKAAHGLVDRASLYRALELFEKLGLVRRIYIGWKFKVELSDVFIHHHHHISCLGCGIVVAITEDAVIEHLIENISRKYGFTGPSHQLEITGYCPVCSRSGNSRSKLAG